jgi:hypothetical protein
VHLFLLVSSHLNQANYGPTVSLNLIRKLLDDICESDHSPFPVSQDTILQEECNQNRVVKQFTRPSSHSLLKLGRFFPHREFCDG